MSTACTTSDVRAAIGGPRAGRAATLFRSAA